MRNWLIEPKARWRRRSGETGEIAGRLAISLASVLAASLMAAGAFAQSAPIPPSGTAEPVPFGAPLDGMDFESLSLFRLGQQVFRREFLPAGPDRNPDDAFDGLGPLFNTSSCAACHVNDGRGAPPPPGGGVYRTPTAILKLAAPSSGGDGVPDADPVYGRQLQDFAAPGHLAEGRMRVDYSFRSVPLADGEMVELRRPRFSVESPAYGPLGPATRPSARIAPPMIGLGLLATIPEAALAALADPDDLDGDGISGRLPRVASAERGRTAAGRFGWKSSQATIADQIATALSIDMGLASTFEPAPAGDCTAAQSACRSAPSGASAQYDGLEVHGDLTDWLERYAEAIAVPTQRAAALDPNLQQLFVETGCAACHTPRFDLPANPLRPHLGGRAIQPYSDLLVHDLGEGLADAVGEGGTDGAEWRTAPLWGLGLSAEVNGNTTLLHDGRARNVTEAILWHGGEAETARDRFIALARRDRARLVAFVNAL